MSETKTDETIYATIRVHFDFVDRIRVLFGWKPVISTKTHYDIQEGTAYTESSVYLLSPLPQKPMGMGLEENEASPEDKGDE